MSSPILPLKGLSGLSIDMPSVATSSEDIDALVSEMTAGDTPPTLIASRGGPPPELLEQILAAGIVEEELRSGGRQLRFRGSPTRPTEILLCDREGNVLRTVSTAEAFEIVAGKPLE
jgi:hypothetical protein